MFKNENEIWEAVKQLKGETTKTLTQGRPNLIVEVEDTGSMNDEIHIAERHTKPTRKDWILWMHTKPLHTYIAKKDVELIQRDRRLIISLKG